MLHRAVCWILAERPELALHSLATIADACPGTMRSCAALALFARSIAGLARRLRWTLLCLRAQALHERGVVLFKGVFVLLKLLRSLPNRLRNGRVQDIAWLQGAVGSGEESVRAQEVERRRRSAEETVAFRVRRDTLLHASAYRPPTLSLSRSLSICLLCARTRLEGVSEPDTEKRAVRADST